MSCLTCSSYDRNGYCDYHHDKTSPGDTCSDEDSRGGGYHNRICSTCESYDPHSQGGFCDHHRRRTYSSSSCPDYS